MRNLRLGFIDGLLYFMLLWQSWLYALLLQRRRHPFESVQEYKKKFGSDLNMFYLCGKKLGSGESGKRMVIR